MGDDSGLLAAKAKARKIEELSILKVFQSSEFKEKQPFPSLESFEIIIPYLYFEKEAPQNIAFDIYDIMERSRNIKVSPEFYELFLERTATLRSLDLSC